MVQKFNIEHNPIVHIILDYMTAYGNDIKKNDVIYELYFDIVNYLCFVLVDPDDVNLLKYELEIDESGDYLELVPENLITALWLINETPNDPKLVTKNNRYINNGTVYSFDEKTKKLIIKKS